MVKRRYIYWVIEILILIFILLFSFIMVNAVSDQSVLKPDDIYLNMVGDGSGGAFITSKLGEEVSGTFVNPNYVERIDFKRGFFPIGSDIEIAALVTEAENQFQLIVNGKSLGKYNLDPSFSLNDFIIIAKKDGKGGAILGFYSKNSEKMYVQFIRVDGSVFPIKPFLIKNYKSTLTDPVGNFISDNAGGAIFYSSSDIDKKSEFIFVREDGSVFPSVDTPAVLNTPLPLIILGDGRGNAVFVPSDFDNINLHFYNGRDDVIVPIGEIDGPSRLIPDERGGFIVLWDDRAFAAGFGLSAAFVSPDNSVSKPIRLGRAGSATEFGSISDFIPDGLGGAILVFREYIAAWDGDVASVQFLHSDGTVSGPFHAVPEVGLIGVVSDNLGGVIILYQEGTEYKVKFISSKGEVSYLQTFTRGDADSNGVLQLSDAIKILNWLFKGGEEPKCLDAADADDNGQIQLTDVVRILNFLFRGGEAPAQPYPEKDFDRTRDQLACVEISA